MLANIQGIGICSKACARKAKPCSSANCRTTLTSGDLRNRHLFGILTFKKLIDRAYGRSSVLDEELRKVLEAMCMQLEQARPKCITASSFSQWSVYRDSSYEPQPMTGGWGGVLVNASAEVVAWFGIALDCNACERLGASEKGTIIYEVELPAAIISPSLWNGDNGDELTAHFGDSDGVRFSLVKASSTGAVGELLMEYHLKLETLAGSRTWFAWVPTEANISDFPSRGVPHPLLVGNLDVSADAKVCLSAVLEFLTKKTCTI